MTHTEVLAICFGIVLVFLWGFVLGIFISELIDDD
jgi:uncharacterized protein YneF (UPF0154 family)